VKIAETKGIHWNEFQFLGVATKVFVNRDQEARWEANRKMKRKIGLFAAALVEQSGGPQLANASRGRRNHHRRSPVPLGHPDPREELG
jgi:hypothetical protein